MLPKGDLRGVWRVGLVACMVFSLMLLATVPLMAQEKSLEKQLEEAKAAIEDQEWVIGQLEKNFFKVVAELNEELDFLRALSSKQLDEIESYLKEMESLRLASQEQAKKLAQVEAQRDRHAKRAGELDASIKEKAAEIAQLEAGVREKEAKVAQLEAGVREKEAKVAQLEAAIKEKTAELTQLEAQRAEQARRLSELEEKAARAEELEALNEEQAKRIERINTLFGKVTDKMRNEIESLSAENAELMAAKDGLQARLDAIDEKHAKLAEDYEEQRGALGRLREAYQEALVTIAEKDNEIAFWEEQAADLDIEIASLEAQLADCGADNARLRRHRLLLGLGFVAASIMACSAH